jgi:plasmid stabilization system protein ParE
VIWTPRARAKLKAIHDHIHQDVPVNAKRITQRILDKAAGLETFPGTHKKVPEARTYNLREFGPSTWRIVYHQRNHSNRRMDIFDPVSMAKRTRQIGVIPKVLQPRYNLDRSINSTLSQPFDISTANTFERPQDAENDMIFFGSYKQDGAKL